MELGRYRYFESVSVLGIFFGIFKVGTVFGIGIVKNRGIGIGISEFIFRTKHTE